VANIAISNNVAGLKRFSSFFAAAGARLFLKLKDGSRLLAYELSMEAQLYGN
jgi:hypothetical protein